LTQVDCSNSSLEHAPNAVRQEHANADGKPFVYVANKTDAKL
jgi:hypothetical protein